MILSFGTSDTHVGLGISCFGTLNTQGFDNLGTGLWYLKYTLFGTWNIGLCEMEYELYGRWNFGYKGL